MFEELDDYISAHISAEPEHLERLYRHTQLTRLYPRMCSGHVQGRLLKMFTAMIRPRRVLELGTFSGYSALCMAEALSGDARLDTIEIDDEYADELRELFAATPGGERVTLHIGDALQLLPQLQGPWDLVYIDANKRLYAEYYHALLDSIAPGGYIIADNTLWSGKVVSDSHDAQTEGIRRFNDLVAADGRVEVAMVPVRDGMTLIRKLR